MIIKQATFVKSSAHYKDCPEGSFPEFAFVGRSNVGKSSLINMLTGFSKLAKISGTPGKTQLINHFLINEEWHLVDLPGYGYAKSSKTHRKKWKAMVDNYLLNRPNLLCTFILLDSRIDPQAIDYEFINWMGSNQLPFVLVLTKTDKISKGKLANSIDRHRNQLMTNWKELPPLMLSSSTTKVGKEEILTLIEDALQSINTDQ